MANLKSYVPSLQDGKTVQFRPVGQSMTPKIESKQLVTVEPIGDAPVAVGDILLCKVRGRHFLHLCTAVKGKRFRISNNHGHHNGWTTSEFIFGRVAKVE